MSDDLRERIDRAIARVPAGKAADAVLAAIAETAVIVERGRWDRVRSAAHAAQLKDAEAVQNGYVSKWGIPLLPGDLEPLP